MLLSLVLVPVDFSAITQPLVQYAAVLARAAGARIELLHVLDGRTPAETADRWQATPRAEFAETQLRELAASPALAALNVGTLVCLGDPEQIIPAIAAGHGAGLLLIGAHGVSGLTRFLMGGTAEAVLRAAPCPTLLVTGARSD